MVREPDLRATMAGGGLVRQGLAVADHPFWREHTSSP